MSSLSTAYAALGSNLGDRAATLESAIVTLRETPGIDVVRVSRFIETAPVGPVGQGPYLNAALELRTTLSPRTLLEAFLRIEVAHGRDRSRRSRWGPRTLDIDLLLYDEQIIDEPGLCVPHPCMHERAFVLAPLAEIAPHAVHPGLGLTVQTMLGSLASPAEP